MSDIGRRYTEYADRWAEQMKPGANPAHAYIEKPAMQDLIPALDGASVLSIGCGIGAEFDEILAHNPSRAVGIDVSEGLIDLAKRYHPEVEFYVQDMEDLRFEGNSFDFAYSSLALHYVADWRPTLRSLRRVLKPNAHFLFSVPHPLLWSGSITREAERKSKLLGYTVDRQADPEVSIYGDYLNVAAHDETWFGDFEVTYFTKPFGAIFGELSEAGFSVVDLIEPKATDDALSAVADGYMASYGSPKDFYEIHQRLPLFLIIDALNSNAAVDLLTVPALAR